jgi:hypothetical protein
MDIRLSSLLLALVACGLTCAATAASPARAPAALETVAERSGFRITGRYGEVERLCLAFEKAYSQAVRCTEFGRTPEGRPLHALVISRSGALTPEEARERNVPVMLMQGGIHAGEIDGKDAGFLAVREMLSGKLAPKALDSFVLVFVPVFNADGHERFGRWNRPNQNGPEEMGWRVTSQNLNLNRDYTKADAPEMQAMLRLLEAWDPVLYVDLHVTDGAQFEHDVANLLEPVYMGDDGLRPAGRAAIDELNQALTAQGSLPLDFYPSFNRTDDPESGFTAGAYSPRFSTGYWPLHNRFALLVETHSWKDYPTRVRITHNIIIKVSEMTAQRGREWRKLMRAADERAARLGGQEVPLDYQAGPHTKTIEFRGYAYTRTPSEISGTLMTRYDPARPQIWRIPLRDTLIPKLTVRAPLGGYIVPPGYAALIGERLGVHGVRFDRIDRPLQSAAVESFRASTAVFGSAPFEGRTLATLTGEWSEERRDLPAGSLFVPIAQPRARLVMTLLEPQAPDSFAAWGFFNASFEAKEYMEAYVAEQVGKEMLANDAALAAEFNKRLAQDPEFAKNPAARLEFFHRRHPSWDERLNLYPVLRVKEKP